MADSERRATEEEQDRGTLQPAPAAARPALPDVEDRSLGEAIVRSGETPQRILERLTTGDPLGLVELSARRVHERHYLIDAERLFERSLLRVAQMAPALKRETRFEPWLLERVDVAIGDLLRQDHERVLSGDLPWRTEHHGFIEEWMRFEPAQALCAAVRFNGLSDGPRRAFFGLLVDTRSVAECLEAGLGPPEVLRENGQRAVTALLGVHFKDDVKPSASLGSDR